MKKTEVIFNNVISNIISNAIITLIPTIAIVTFSIYKKQENLFLILVIYVLYLILMLIIGYKFKFKRIATGREIMMHENTKLIKKKNIAKIFSTRVTYWLLDESSPNRVSFRNALTENIHSGTEVKRLWHIRNCDDVKRLVYYLEKYKDYDNLSVKCIIGNNIILPEILISYPYAASISLPQENSPRKICMTYHFKGKHDITYWMEYFNVLWELATPIFMSGRLFKQNINKLKDIYKEDQNENDMG